MNQQQQQLAQIIQKIEVFRGLSLEEIRQIIHVCHLQTYEPNQQVYKVGEPGSEMLILLHGQVMIVSQAGEPLGSVTSGTCIGEMGLFTGHPRSAIVVAMTASGGVSIRKVDMEVLMTRYPAMYVKVLRNIVTILSDRIASANSRNEEHMKTIARLSEQIEKA